MLERIRGWVIGVTFLHLDFLFMTGTIFYFYNVYI